MQRHRSMPKRMAHIRRTALSGASRSLFLIGLALVLFVADPVIVASSEIPIFRAPPRPAKLANILYPTRYRSIVLNDSQPEAPVGAFGLMINFEFDSTTIQPESEPLLASVGEMLRLKRIQHRAIVIEGHTDATGPAAYNQHLSERRALAIKRYLVDRYGVDPSRLSIVGFGERELHDRATPSSGVNRRVQFRADAGTRS